MIIRLCQKCNTKYQTLRQASTLHSGESFARLYYVDDILARGEAVLRGGLISFNMD